MKGHSSSMYLIGFINWGALLCFSEFNTWDVCAVTCQYLIKIVDKVPLGEFTFKRRLGLHVTYAESTQQSTRTLISRLNTYGTSLQQVAYFSSMKIWISSL